MDVVVVETDHAGSHSPSVDFRIHLDDPSYFFIRIFYDIYFIEDTSWLVRPRTDRTVG